MENEAIVNTESFGLVEDTIVDLVDRINDCDNIHVTWSMYTLAKASFDFPKPLADYHAKNNRIIIEQGDDIENKFTLCLERSQITCMEDTERFSAYRIVNPVLICTFSLEKNI